MDNAYTNLQFFAMTTIVSSVPTSNLLNFLISLYICSGNTQFTVVPPIFRIQNEVSILHTVYSRILSFMELWLVPT